MNVFGISEKNREIQRTKVNGKNFKLSTFLKTQISFVHENRIFHSSQVTHGDGRDGFI